MLRAVIRLSLGTAARLGMLELRAADQPTTAYLLHGEGCRKNCAFCSQARDAGRQAGRLGRVIWPSFSLDRVLRELQEGPRRGLQRICLQAVSGPGGSGAVTNLARQIKSASALPLSLSVPVHSTTGAAAFFEAGAARLSIALDAASAEIYRRCKGGDFQKQLRLLLDCARLWPGRLSTHLICGLGESEEEMASLLALLLRKKITVGLFAFTPLKGTLLEGYPPPAPASYRRMQALHHLLRCGHISTGDLSFREGRLLSFGIGGGELERLLAGGEAFRTSGCPGCNRPYFNERPGGFIFNYPRPLKASEIAAALTLVHKGDE